MKKIMIFAMLAVVALPLISFKPADKDVISKEDGMTVVNTTSIAENVVGYVAATPVKIYIKKDKVVKIEALPNQETPKYIARVKRLVLNKWNDMNVGDAAKLQVDGVTGATFTSDAIKENVKIGLEYYLKNK